MGTAFLSLRNALLTAWTRLRSLAFLLATTCGGLSLWGTCLYPPLFLQFFSLSGLVSRNPLCSTIASACSGAVIRAVQKLSVVHWVMLFCVAHTLAVYMQDDTSFAPDIVVHFFGSRSTWCCLGMVEYETELTLGVCPSSRMVLSRICF